MWKLQYEPAYAETANYDGWFRSKKEFDKYVATLPHAPVPPKPQFKTTHTKPRSVLRNRPPLPSPSREPETVRKTKMCKYGSRCNRIKSCNFAHSVDELEPSKCSFDKRCKYKATKCFYIHTGESKVDYLNRTSQL